MTLKSTYKGELKPKQPKRTVKLNPSSPYEWAVFKRRNGYTLTTGEKEILNIGRTKGKK